MKIYQRGPSWWADFGYNDAHGRPQRWRKSLKLLVADTSARHARQRAEEIRRGLETRAVLGSLGVDVTPPPAPVTCPFSGLARQWIEHKRPDWSLVTPERYESAIRRYLYPWGRDREVASITVTDVLALRADLAARVGVATVNHSLSVLRGIFDYGVEAGYMPSNPASKVKAVKDTRPEGKRGSRRLSPAELSALLGWSREHQPQWYPLWVLAVDTGLRPGELRGLRWENVDLDARELRVRETRVRLRDGEVNAAPKSASGLRTVPLTARAVAALRAHRHLRGPFVFYQSRGGNLSATTMWIALHDAAQGAGIARARPHDLRHTFASRLIDAGAGVPAVSELMGHKSIQTTHRYLHLASDSSRATVALLERQEEGDHGTPAVHEARR
jgi:integrase